jgi:hypothetical protein
VNATSVILPPVPSQNRACRVPVEVDGIQVNFCRNPTCSNFGVAASQTVSRGRPALGAPPNPYTISGQGKGIQGIRCNTCGEAPPIKSNLGIAEEVARLGSHLLARPSAGCSGDACASRGISPHDRPDLYDRFGKTRAGSSRWRCKRCGKTISTPASPLLRQRVADKNGLIFTLLMNKMPMRRILETAEISAPTLYGKIDFLHRQAMLFAGHYERALPSMAIRRLYLASDRQDYLVNWARKRDRRPVQLTAVGTADGPTGYAFGMHLNFDGEIDQTDPATAAIIDADKAVPVARRRLARLWLRSDAEAEAATREAHAQIALPEATSLAGDIARTYRQAMLRRDIEAPPEFTSQRALPVRGSQVRSEYVLFAHFEFLRRLIGHAEKVRFFLDLDSGIRGACLSAFHRQILAGQCEAFYVRISKALTQDQKAAAVMEAKLTFFSRVMAQPEVLAAAQASGIGPTEAYDQMRTATPTVVQTVEARVRTAMLVENRRQATAQGSWNDRWVVHPQPTMGEPEKALCWLTDRGHLDAQPEHIANLMHLASLHAIDRFFMQARRRISMVERPIATASRGDRIWHGYSPYNPEVLARLPDIYRVFYNFLRPGQDKRTPAMRLGLVHAVGNLEDVIGFQ